MYNARDSRRSSCSTGHDCIFQLFYDLKIYLFLFLAFLAAANDHLITLESFISPLEKKEREVIAKLSSSEATPTAAAFEAIFFPYVKELLIEGNVIEGGPRKKFTRRITPKTDMKAYTARKVTQRQIKLRRKKVAHSDANLSYNFVQCVLNRCISQFDQSKEGKLT